MRPPDVIVRKAFPDWTTKPEPIMYEPVVLSTPEK
jgi:hypothetical protein